MLLTLDVFAPRACFRRPEMSGDLVSYDAMPPPVARRVFSALHGAPSRSWRVETIEILNPIRSGWDWVDEIEGPGRRMHVLFDVAYRLTGRLSVEAPKLSEASAERAARDKIARLPQAVFLGLKEFPAQIEILDLENGSDSCGVRETRDLGWMTYDFTGGGRGRPRFFRAAIDQGVIDLRSIREDDLAV